MRFYIAILILFIMLLSSVSFAQTYGYDKEYQKQLKESGVEITDKQKEQVRADIKKWANFYLNKHYKYNEKALLTHPNSKEKKTFNFDCSGYVAAVYWTSNIAVFEKQAILAFHVLLSKPNPFKIIFESPINRSLIGSFILGK